MYLSSSKRTAHSVTLGRLSFYEVRSSIHCIDMQRLNNKESPASPAAAPRQLEPIQSFQVQRASTASPVLGSKTHQACANGSSNPCVEDLQATDPTWPEKTFVRPSVLIPRPLLQQHRCSSGQKYLVTELTIAQHRTSTSVSSSSKRDSRKLADTSSLGKVGDKTREEEHREPRHTSISENADSSSFPSGPTDVEKRQLQKMFRDTLGSLIYEDGGKQFHGRVDKRGLTPFVTFTSTETPPSEAKNPLLSSKQTTTCGFCNSTKLVWILQCAFCGSSRMSDAPRLKYLLDMILTMEPLIKPDQLGKKILDYARFDRVAMRVEGKLKEAGLVRARTAIMMMSRTINLLREQMVRIVFRAWKHCNASDLLHAATIARMIRINDLQVKDKSRQIAFQLWRGHVARITDERAQKLIIASKRNEQTKLRRMWGYWQKFMRMRAREKLELTKQHYEKELNESPQESLRVIERLQENHRESQKLIFAAGDSLLEILQHTLHWADRDVQEVLALKDMYPITAGYFFEQAHGHATLEALRSGQISTGLDSHPIRDEADSFDDILEQTKKKLGRMKPSESLIQWLNFQRRRTFEAAHSAGQAMPKPQVIQSVNSSSEGDKNEAGDVQQPEKPRSKDKQKQFKEVKGLQELRAAISSPGVMLKLLCHMSPEALAELQRTRDESGTGNATSMVAETLTSTTLSPTALLQLKQYFKIAQRVLELPPDVVSRDAFLLNDFDSLYAYAVYLYQLHSNLIAPGLGLSPNYRLNYNFFQSQWEKVKQALVTDEMDPFAQQQFFIFLAKIRRVSLLFNRFGAIGRAIRQIAQWHQQTVVRDTYNDFSRRVLGKDSNISVALEKETLAAWVSLPSSKLLPLCENEDEFREVEQVFKDNVLDLIKIFRIYGSAAGGKGILEQEFLKVMTKAGVTDKKNILRSTLQSIYQQSRQVSDSTGLTSGTSSGTAAGTAANAADVDEDDDRGATPNEFFEALTRVAFHNLQRRKDASAAILGGGTSLLASVTELVIEKVVPLTKKFQEQGLAFKKQMIHPEVQNVCKAQEKKLKRVFGVYSQRNKNPNSRGKLMDLGDFESLLKDRRLIDALFPHGRIKQLVAFVQQDGEIATTASSINGYEAECEFVYSEFIEALAAIAVYRNANPYLPFAKKLETFFDENF